MVAAIWMNLMPDGAMFATNSSKKSVGKNSENLATEPIARHLVAAHNQKSHPTLLVESESNHKRINPPEDWVEQELTTFTQFQAIYRQQEQKFCGDVRTQSDYDNHVSRLYADFFPCLMRERKTKVYGKT